MKNKLTILILSLAVTTLIIFTSINVMHAWKAEDGQKHQESRDLNDIKGIPAIPIYDKSDVDKFVSGEEAESLKKELDDTHLSGGPPRAVVIDGKVHRLKGVIDISGDNMKVKKGKNGGEVIITLPARTKKGNKKGKQ